MCVGGWWVCLLKIFNLFISIKWFLRLLAPLVGNSVILISNGLVLNSISFIWCLVYFLVILFYYFLFNFFFFFYCILGFSFWFIFILDFYCLFNTNPQLLAKISVNLFTKYFLATPPVSVPVTASAFAFAHIIVFISFHSFIFSTPKNGELTLYSLVDSRFWRIFFFSIFSHL